MCIRDRLKYVEENKKKRKMKEIWRWRMTRQVGRHTTYANSMHLSRLLTTNGCVLFLWNQRNVAVHHHSSHEGTERREGEWDRERQRERESERESVRAQMHANAQEVDTTGECIVLAGIYSRRKKKRKKGGEDNFLIVFFFHSRFSKLYLISKSRT